jgi:flagellar hook-basal body complex protein FliE
MSDMLVNSTGIPNSIIDSIPARPKAAEPGTSFSAILGNAIQEVNDLQAQAGQETQKVMTGEITDIHSAMIAVQKADVSFQMMMQVRNKIVSAYQEIMKMQV